MHGLFDRPGNPVVLRLTLCKLYCRFAHEHYLYLPSILMHACINADCIATMCPIGLGTLIQMLSDCAKSRCAALIPIFECLTTARPADGITANKRFADNKLVLHQLIVRYAAYLVALSGATRCIVNAKYNL